MKFISHGNGIESRLETERINAIILEDSEQYTGLIQKLWNQIHKVEETLFLYGAENELLDMSKQCDLLFSIRDLSLQNSRIQKKLITYLAEEIQMSELYDKMVENQAELLQIMEEIKNLSEYPICLNEDYNIADILKYVGVKLSETEGTAVYQYDYMDLSRMILRDDENTIQFIIRANGILDGRKYSVSEIQWPQNGEN